jgi:tRNA-2-methylthio-N6-dimethylallyladenosine synthase
MKYHIKIFGCQMNYSDAERISTYLEKLGLEPAFKNKADLPDKALASAGLIVFITCGVRQSAENRVYGQINNIRKKFPTKKIVLTGCLAHRKDVQRRLKDKVDLYFPIDKFQIFENWVIGNWKLEIPAQKNYHQQCDSYLSIDAKYTHTFQAFVPVMTGCNNFCAYCVVPYARGREYSRPAKDILNEVKSLIKTGCKEIILLGQNVNSYRTKTLGTKKIVSFSDLLKMIDGINGNFWITFLTSHPKDMSKKLIKTIAKSKKICEYVSLPAQSGDNAILCKMNRYYSIEHYKNLVKTIRAYYKRYKPKVSPSISTDIIVGFPGETKKQFDNTATLLCEMKFDMAYVSQYSPRPETAAWKMKDNVSKKEKVRRDKVLTNILTKTALENNKKYIGKTVEVLVDKIISNPAQPYRYSSHSRFQKKVIFFTNEKITVGNFAKVKIIKAKAFGLEGKIIKNT